MKGFIISCFFMLSLIIYSNGQTGIMAAGTEATGPGGSASLSVGQIDFKSIPGVQFSLDQGVQQAYEVSEILVINERGVEINVQVFPNPVAGEISIQSENIAQSGVTCNVYSNTGALLYSSELKDHYQLIDCSEWAPGLYLVQVSDSILFSKVFQVIKN